MARYHITAKGSPGICRAAMGNCPLGGVNDHFSSASAATQAFEAKMGTTAVPRATKKPGLQELNELAKNATSSKDFSRIVAAGSDRTLRNLAANPHAPAPVLEKAYVKAKSRSVKAALSLHSSTPVAVLEPEDYALRVSLADWRERQDLLADDAVTDAHVDALQALGTVSGGNLNYGEILRNRYNLLSTDKIIELSEHSWVNLEQGIASGRYPLEERIGEVKLKMLRTSIRSFKDPIYLELIAEKAAHEKDELILAQVASNDHASPEALAIVATHATEGETLVAARRHPEISPQGAEVAEAKSRTAASYGKLERLDSMVNGGLAKAIGGTHLPNTSSDTRLKSLQFQREKVARLGLTSEDIDVFVRYRQGQYLFMTSYDEATGIYSGLTD